MKSRSENPGLPRVRIKPATSEFNLKPVTNVSFMAPAQWKGQLIAIVPLDLLPNWASSLQTLAFVSPAAHENVPLEEQSCRAKTEEHKLGLLLLLVSVLF